MLNFCEIVCHISIQSRHLFSYLIPPHSMLSIVCNASHLLCVISRPFIGHPYKMKMWKCGEYMFTSLKHRKSVHEPWVECKICGSAPRNVKLWSIMKFNFNFRWAIFKNMNCSSFLDKHRVTFLPAALVTTWCVCSFCWLSSS